MNVVCIGAGYVGSVTAAAFAEWGHHTTVVDIDPRKIALLNAGQSPIYEPGLETLIARHAGTLLFASTAYEAVRDADVVFIAVGTPSTPSGGADTTYVAAAARRIGEHLNGERFTVIVNKSTVPVGTADLVASLVEEASGLQEGTHFAVASNPEFLREGFAVRDVLAPDRIVVGTDHDRARIVLRELYERLLTNAPATVYFETEVRTAELIKYASNAFLAMKISYVNEMARLCEAVGANALELAHGMGLDSRIGGKFLQVSSGWSGSCFPKDTQELALLGRHYDCELSLVEAAIASNERMHRYCIDKLRRRLKTLNGKRVGILGLTFKPDTDDARVTQAAAMIRALLEFGSQIRVHDPQGMEMFRRYYPGLSVRYCGKAEETAHGADALLLLTHWEEYRSLDWPGMHAAMRQPYILDTRNFLHPPTLQALGFRLEGLGVERSAFG